MTDVIRDITVRNALEAQLRLAQADAEAPAAVNGEFLAIIRHELRTPLTSIVGFTRLAAEQADLQGLTRTYVERVGEASRALLSTVNDIRDFSGWKRGRSASNPSRHRLRNSVARRWTCSCSRPGQRTSTFVLDCEVEASDLMISLDPDRICQILFNLVGNAVKFTDSGEVTLRTRYHGERSVGLAPRRLSRRQHP